MKALVAALLLCLSCATQKPSVPALDAAACPTCAPVLEPEIRLSSGVQLVECAQGGHCVQAKGEKWCATVCR